MTLSGQALARKYQVSQIENGALAAALVMEVCNQYRAGRLSEKDFVGTLIAQSKLSHDKATSIATDFLATYRLIEAPDENHADPLLADWDGGAAFGRAYGVSQDLAAIDVEPLYYEREFQKIAQNFAVRSHRYALDAGRQTIEFSAAANGKRWRRITDGNPCAFCAMLSTRSDYRTKESALTVVGRAHGYGTASYRLTGDVSRPGDRLRGSRGLGERYHNFCGCTVVEVLSEWVFTPAEQAQHELYNRAAKQCDRDGVPRTAKNVLAKMRELDDGSVIHDAAPPATQASGAGGGKKPPSRVRGVLGPDTPDEFPEFNGWRPGISRSEIEEFSLIDAEILLDGDGTGHGHHRYGSGKGKSEFPEGWTATEVVDWINAIIDYPSDGKPLPSAGFAVYGAYRQVTGVVYIRRYGRWVIATGYPMTVAQWNHVQLD